jgi:hypothetical protein
MSDESSRLMLGMKDFVSVKQPDGNRVHIQKRLILSNLRELYQNFKEKHPVASIGLSKFAELRPKHCILAGASGTHSVCVLYHPSKRQVNAAHFEATFTIQYLPRVLSLVDVQSCHSRLSSWFLPWSRQFEDKSYELSR